MYEGPDRARRITRWPEDVTESEPVDVGTAARLVSPGEIPPVAPEATASRRRATASEQAYAGSTAMGQTADGPGSMIDWLAERAGAAGATVADTGRFIGDGARFLAGAVPDGWAQIIRDSPLDEIAGGVADEYRWIGAHPGEFVDWLIPDLPSHPLLDGLGVGYRATGEMIAESTIGQAGAAILGEWGEILGGRR